MSEEQPKEVTQESGEYEREPIPAKAQKGPSAFWGMYAGEHTAGTEFLIGPLFLIQWGVGGMTLILGLILGNLAAVLSWRYITATIATRARLTLYYQLEKITGRSLVNIYNVANGVLFCFLAGSMITVSATAFGPFMKSVEAVNFTTTMPPNATWCVLVVLIGAAMTFVAMKGYGLVARVGKIAAPWMFLIFLASALVILGKLDTKDVVSALTPAKDVVATKGFWAVFFFAWFCNGAMHVGMADLSVLRFAKKPSCGWASASGMFLGHCVAWLCAALLLVYWGKQMGSNELAKNVSLGTMVNDAVGIPGLICVVIAGWTTANPTLYRAGLAFQSLFPAIGRVGATILAGAVCIAAGLFPKFAMTLLDFVGIYGTILAPVGAILFVDFWLSKRLGFPGFWAEKTGSSFNVVALVSWLLPVAAGAYFYKFHDVFPSYMTLPVWISAGLLYVVLAKSFLKNAQS